MTPGRLANKLLKLTQMPLLKRARGWLGTSGTVLDHVNIASRNEMWCKKTLFQKIQKGRDRDNMSISAPTTFTNLTQDDIWWEAQHMDQVARDDQKMGRGVLRLRRWKEWRVTYAIMADCNSRYKQQNIVKLK